MKRGLIAIGAIGALALPILETPVIAAGTATAFAELTQPSPDSSMSVEYAKVVAAQAYVWG